MRLDGRGASVLKTTTSKRCAGNAASFGNMRYWFVQHPACMLLLLWWWWWWWLSLAVTPRGPA